MEILANRIVILKNKKVKVISTGPGLIFFGQKWCGYCTEAKPKFRQAHSVYYNTNPNMYYIEGTKNEELFDKLVKLKIISGYPTIYKFDKNGILTNKYNGPRTIESFVLTMSKIK